MINEPGMTAKVREVVARFDDAEKFESAAEAVEMAGIDRSAISMMASEQAVEEKLGHRFARTESLEDDGAVPQTVYSDRHEMAEGKAAAVGIPGYVAGGAAGLAVVASGGALAAAMIAAAAGGAVGAGIGALAGQFISSQHAENLEAQIEKGGLLLWVAVRDEAEEAKVRVLLEENGGRDVHAHLIDRLSGDQEVPLANPDPFL